MEKCNVWLEMNLDKPFGREERLQISFPTSLSLWLLEQERGSYGGSTKGTSSACGGRREEAALLL
jgi:hypothetical protein